MRSGPRPPQPVTDPRVCPAEASHAPNRAGSPPCHWRRHRPLLLERSMLWPLLLPAARNPATDHLLVHPGCQVQARRGDARMKGDDHEARRAGDCGSPLRAVKDGFVSRCALFERLSRAGRVTQVSAPAGSGKTVLLRSWIGAVGLEQSMAWVSVRDEGRDPQRFWASVLDSLRQTAAGSALVRPLSAAPDLDGWAVVEQLLKDLAPLEDRVLAGGRRHGRSGLGRGAAPTGAAGDAGAAGVAVRAGRPAARAAGTAPAAAGGRADRDPRG